MIEFIIYYKFYTPISRLTLVYSSGTATPGPIATSTQAQAKLVCTLINCFQTTQFKTEVPIIDRQFEGQTSYFHRVGRWVNFKNLKLNGPTSCRCPGSLVIIIIIQWFDDSKLGNLCKHNHSSVHFTQFTMIIIIMITI